MRQRDRVTLHTVLGLLVTMTGEFGCGTQRGDALAESHDVLGAEARPLPAWTTCEDDRDCVAVPQAECCATGLLEALNRRYVAAYRDHYRCHAKLTCPFVQINDDRLPRCSAEHRCELVPVSRVAGE